MRLVRENMIPVALLALWVAVSGYTLYALKGLESLSPAVVEASIDLTVTYPQFANVAATTQVNAR
jgi:hypothetical protein